MLIIHAYGSCVNRVITIVCLLICTICQKPMQLLPYLTLKCLAMSPGNLFNLGSKGQLVKVTIHKNIAGVGLCTLVSAGFFSFF